MVCNTVLAINNPIWTKDSRALSEHFSALRGIADYTRLNQPALEKLGLDKDTVTRFSSLIENFDAANDDLSHHQIGNIITMTERIGTHLSGLFVTQLVDELDHTNTPHSNAKETNNMVTTLNTELNYFMALKAEL